LVARIATFVPPAAPMVVPVRSAAGTIAWWEVALSAGLLVAATLVIVRLAARVYAGGVLFTRGQLKIGDALARAEA
jgi:ABC-2 type transport system permease protein